MFKIDCPVKGCRGGETTSGRPNPLGHVKQLAKTELLNNFINGKGEIPHAKWLKKHTKKVVVIKVMFSI